MFRPAAGWFLGRPAEGWGEHLGNSLKVRYLTGYLNYKLQELYFFMRHILWTHTSNSHTDTSMFISNVTLVENKNGIKFSSHNNKQVIFLRNYIISISIGYVSQHVQNITKVLAPSVSTKTLPSWQKAVCLFVCSWRRAGSVSRPRLCSPGTRSAAPWHGPAM